MSLTRSSSLGERESCLTTGREHGKNVPESLANVLQIGTGARGERQRILLFVDFDLRPQVLTCAGDGESLLVEQLLDAQNALDVLAAIHTLAGTALYRLELGELSFPKAQNVSRQVAQAGNFSNAEIELFRNQHIGCRFSCSSVSWAHLTFPKQYSLKDADFLPTRVSSTTAPLEQPYFQEIHLA